MGSIITDHGLQKALDMTFGLAAADPVDALGVSDFGTLLASTTSIGTATNKHVVALDAGTSRSGNTVTVKGTIAKADAAFIITTITLHHDGVGVFTGVFGGVDGQSIQKNSTFALTITLKVTFSSA